MKITIVNRSTSPVPAPGDVSVAAGATQVVTGRTVAEYGMAVANYASSLVQVHGELEADDKPPLTAVMKHPADPAGGANTVAGVGFDLKTQDGNDAGVQPQFWMGVFQNAACTILATTGNLSTATVGTIVSGSGTNLIKVTPDATGEFACSLNDTIDETVYMKIWPVAETRLIDCSQTDSVTFTPV